MHAQSPCSSSLSLYSLYSFYSLSSSSPLHLPRRGCLPSRSKEILLTAVTEGPASIPDHLAPAAVTQGLPANLTVWRTPSKLVPSCYPCKGKEWTASSSADFHQSCTARTAFNTGIPTSPATTSSFSTKTGMVELGLDSIAFKLWLM